MHLHNFKGIEIAEFKTEYLYKADHARKYNLWNCTYKKFTMLLP